MTSVPITANLLGMARTAELAGNSEEALGYFNRVLELNPKESDAWLGKGKAAGWLSTLAHFRLNETLVAFGHAIATADESNKASVTAEAVVEVNKLVSALYGMARRHLDEYVALPDSWNQYVTQIAQLIDVTEAARGWDPSNQFTLENIIHLCKDNMEGVSYRDPYDNNAPKAWHLSPDYESYLKSLFESASAELRQIDPEFEPPVIEKKTADSCFVITATMGDSNHPTVWLLRAFRDDWLSQRDWGKRLVREYYVYGPVVAAFIEKHEHRRLLAFVFVVSPAKWLAGALLRRSRRFRK